MVRSARWGWVVALLLVAAPAHADEARQTADPCAPGEVTAGAFERLDRDGDGALSLDEYAGCLDAPATERNPEMRSTLQTAFEDLDADGDGRVFKRELPHTPRAGPLDPDAPGGAVSVRQPPAQITADRANRPVVVRPPAPDVSQERPPPGVRVAVPPPAVSPTGPTTSVRVTPPAPAVTRDERPTTVAVNQPQAQVEADAAPGGVSVRVSRSGRPGPVRQWRDLAGSGIDAGDLVGAPLRDPAGEDIGTVDALVLAPALNEPYAVIRMGGFLGFGSRQVVVPLDDLAVSDDAMPRLRTAMSREQVRRLGRYDEAAFDPLPEGMLGE